RSREHLQDRQQLHHARPREQEHHRARRSARSARQQRGPARPLLLQPHSNRGGDPMSAPTNQWKLGAFVVGSVVIGLAATLAISEQVLRKTTVSYKSYLDEAVTGLETGSPVTYRGVKIGNVSGIDVAPDRRHVEVTYSLGVAVLDRLGLAGATHGKEAQITLPPELRRQLASDGLTGPKVLQTDLVDNRLTPTAPRPVPV